MLLDNHPVYRDMGEVYQKGKPILSLIEGNIQGVFRTQIEQAFSNWIFTHTAGIDAVGITFGKIRADGYPALTVICGFVYIGIPIVHFVEIDRNVACTGIMP
jgi:hypothetical protein